jgi:hypothetical protein
MIEASARDDARMKAIALYYKLKKRFKNSRIYDYSPRSTASKLQKQGKPSEYLISKYVPMLIDMDMAHLSEQNNKTDLILCSIKNTKGLFNEKRKYIIKIEDKDSLKEIVYKMKAVAICKYVRQQGYVAKCKFDLKSLKEGDRKSVSIRRLRKMYKAVRSNGEVADGNTYLSARKAKLRFGINQSDFKRFREYTSDKLMWTWQPGGVSYRNCSYYEYIYSKIEKPVHSYMFWYNGIVYTVYPTRITINS